MTGKRGRHQQPEPEPLAGPHGAYGRYHAIGQHEYERQHAKTDDRVRVAAMVDEIADRRRCDHRIRDIDIWKVGGNQAGAHQERPLGFDGATSRHRIRKRDAHERMREVVHYAVCALKRNRT